MALALANAVVREGRVERSACTTSAPRAERASDAREVGLRVRQRTCQLGSLRNVWATEEPWLPVAPTMAMIFFEDGMTGGVKLGGKF